MSKFTAGWYVLYTKPRHEKKVAAELTDSSIRHYLPMRTTLRSWHDRKKYISAPLFQSYVFVYIKNLTDYYLALDCQGVWRFLRFGKEVARVNDQVIEDIRLLVEFGEDIEVSSDYMQPGQQLYIKHGPLTGLSCEVVQVNRQQKILVRIHLIQRNLLITLPAEYFISLSA